MMQNNAKIAVTGGIGSGKSFVLRYLKELGYNTVSADEISKAVVNRQDVLQKLKNIYPLAVSGDNELTLNKKVFTEILFGVEEDNKKLNALLHPVIMEEVYKETKKGGIRFAEVPLLFEGGYEKNFDTVWVIKRNKEDRINAVIKRAGITRGEVEKRMDSQIDYETHNFSNYVVIENDGSKEDLKAKIDALLKDL